ncbi:hypothetical protein BST80_002745, partial [Spiroplasma sp. Moj]|nr:hypothetical protein [Spiroplasma sp. Moj]
ISILNIFYRNFKITRLCKKSIVKNKIATKKQEFNNAKIKLKQEKEKLIYKRTNTRINEIEKYYKFLSSDELKLTITNDTWKEINNLFFLNLKEEFLFELTIKITFFAKEDHSGLGGSITDADISSLAYLIWEHFSYYYNLTWNLDVNQAIEITSYSGYDHGYWDTADPSRKNRVVGENTSEIFCEEEEKLEIKTSFHSSKQEYEKAQAEYKPAAEKYIKTEEKYNEEKDEFIIKTFDYEIFLRKENNSYTIKDKNVTKQKLNYEKVKLEKVKKEFDLVE